MKKCWSSLATLGLLCAASAHAGTVSGKVRLANPAGAGAKEAVVVWLEGQDRPKPPEGSVRIAQKNLQFSPGFVVAVQGQKIEMPNYDDVSHNVYSFTGMNQFNLGVSAKGDYRSLTFGKAGIVDVFCSIHHQMHSRVFVVPTRYFASIMPGQPFNIADVPPGKYVLKVWHERSRMLEKTVIVPRTGVLSQNLVLENSTAPATTAKQ
ncbi:MAG TPA: plastocyanin/azurin family copper-binding protein [Candidatus Angelobacter sp.]